MSTGEEYSTYTNERGYFRFELPTGNYDVTTAQEYGLIEDDRPFSSMKGNIAAESHKCWEHDFSVKPATSVGQATSNP